MNWPKFSFLKSGNIVRAGYFLPEVLFQSLKKWISTGIAAANNSPITDKFNLGVIQV